MLKRIIKALDIKFVKVAQINANEVNILAVNTN